MLSYGANPNLLNFKGLTGLIISLIRKDNKMLGILLHHGADAKRPDFRGKLPL